MDRASLGKPTLERARATLLCVMGQVDSLDPVPVKDLLIPETDPRIAEFLQQCADKALALRCWLLLACISPQSSQGFLTDPSPSQWPNPKNILLTGPCSRHMAYAFHLLLASRLYSHGLSPVIEFPFVQACALCLSTGFVRLCLSCFGDMLQCRSLGVLATSFGRMCATHHVCSLLCH